MQPEKLTRQQKDEEDLKNEDDLKNKDNLNLDHVPMVYKAHVAVGIVIFMEGHFH